MAEKTGRTKIVKEEAGRMATSAERADDTKKPTISTESVYSAKELAAGAEKIFGTRAECALAALKEAGRKEATLSEAKEIVTTFMRKEIY